VFHLIAGKNRFEPMGDKRFTRTIRNIPPALKRRFKKKEKRKREPAGYEAECRDSGANDAGKQHER